MQSAEQETNGEKQRQKLSSRDQSRTVQLSLFFAMIDIDSIASWTETCFEKCRFVDSYVVCSPIPQENHPQLAGCQVRLNDVPLRVPYSLPATRPRALPQSHQTRWVRIPSFAAVSTFDLRFLTLTHCSTSTARADLSLASATPSLPRLSASCCSSCCIFLSESHRVCLRLVSSMPYVKSEDHSSSHSSHLLDLLS